MTCKHDNRIALLIITLLAAAAFGAIFMVGCSATQKSNLWFDSAYHSPPMKKILVIALRKDQLRRRMWEDAIIAEMGNKQLSGTTAIASYQLFPDDVPDTSSARLMSEKEGFDGVVLIAPVQRDSTTNEMPGYMQNEQVMRYSQRWGTYVTRYEDVYYPGYLETETTVSVRTDLLVPREDGKLVWSVTSQVVDPTSADEFRKSVATLVVDQLKKDRFIN